MLLQSRQGVVREALACPLKSVRVVKSTSAQRVMVSRRATVRVAARIKVEPFVGANCYYLLNRARDSPMNGERFQVTKTLDDIKSMGMTVVRCWAFQDDPNNDSQPVHKMVGKDASGKPIMVYNEDMLRGLRWLLDEANNRGLKLMLTLTNGDPTDFGGVRQYYRWAEGKEPKDSGSFFESKAAKDLFRSYARKIVDDFKEHPAVHSWDIINEPRAKSDAKSSQIAEWIDEMASSIKRWDPMHPVTAGVEGFYGPKQHGKGDGSDGYNPYSMGSEPGIEGCDWVKEISSPSLDFACIHLYPTSWGNYAENNPVEFSKKWVQTHIDEIRKAQPDEPIPLVLQEYNLKPLGIPEEKEEKDKIPQNQWKPSFKKDTDRVDMFRELRKKMFQDGNDEIYIGNMVWMVACPERAGDDNELKYLYANDIKDLKGIKAEYQYLKGFYTKLQHDESVSELKTLAKEVADRNLAKKNGIKPS